MAKASSEVLEMMRDDAKRPPPPDKLDKLRKGVADLRSMELERKDLEEKLARNGENIHRMKTVELVALFDQAKVDNVGIPAEGNLPPYTMEVGWHYKAKKSPPLKLLGATVERTAKLLGARATAPKQAAKEAKSTVKKGKR
jgi:hypothetical protein